MRTAPNPHVETLCDAVAAYVDAIAVPALDARAIAARREALQRPRAAHRPVLRTVALAFATILIVLLAANASAVVAGMQRVLSAFALVGTRTVPLSVREVDLATARADVPFEIIVPPALPRTIVTLHEIRSSASPAGDSVVFDLDMRRPGPAVSIIETGARGRERRVVLSLAEPDRGDAKVAPQASLPELSGNAGRHVSVAANLGTGTFTPITWVTRGTRIVLISPPGTLSEAQTREIRSAMSK